MLIVSIMISAVAFVVTFDSPPPGAGEAREGLETKAEDALAILHDTPIESRFGEDQLSAFIAECLNENCDNLSARLRALVPRGASYALYVSNGYETYPVLVQGEPMGEAVTAVQAFEPRWSSTFVSTATEGVTPDDALLVYALPIFHSNPLTPGGSQLLVKLTGKRADGSEYVLIGSYATVAQAASDPEASAASLYFVDSAGTPLAVHALTDAEGNARRFTLRLHETQNVASIPAGAEVSVHVPRGFTAVADPAANPGWNLIASATDKDGAATGSTLRANLTSPLRNAYQDLVFDMTYHGDELDYYPFVATLSKGATATASVLVRGESHESEPPLATPSLLMSVPSPMGRGAPTTWTLSAYIPVSSGVAVGLLPQTIQVEKVEIVEKEGNDIFDCGTPVDPIAADGGSWACTAESLTWTGSKTLSYDSLLNLSFRVRASGIAGPNDARSQFVPPVTFDAHTGRLVERTGWGFYRGTVLPRDAQYEGFDATIGDGHVVRSNATYRSASLPGGTKYNVSTLASVQDALYGSYVTAEDRNVPVGGEVVINANVQSVLFTLAELGQRAGVTLRFYPPWSDDERVPIYEQQNLDQGLLSGEITQMIMLDVNDDGYPDPVVGTSNGRVLAFHGLSGQRLQGNAFTVPLLPGVTNLSNAAGVTALTALTRGGEEYIVVGVDDSAPEGVYVLADDLTLRYISPIVGGVVALDTESDIDGDGERDIVAVRAYSEAATSYAEVVALEFPATGSTLALVPTPQDGSRLATVVGTPTTVATQQRAGPRGETPGILVPLQTLVDPGLRIDLSIFPPSITQGSLSTPRAGVHAANRYGEMTSTLFGAPAYVMRHYDQGGDQVDDVVFGGTSGYVIMSNGTVLTQPLYSYLVVNTAFVDGDSRSSAETYTLTLDGNVLMTDDAWVTLYGTSIPFPGAKAVSSNWTSHFWVVGPANGIWKTTDPLTGDTDPLHERHMRVRDFGPITLADAAKGSGTYSFTTNIHEFRDVYAKVDTVMVVGAKCAVVLVCTEPPLLRTTNGGTTWRLLTSQDGSMLDAAGAQVTADLNRIEFMSDGTGWIVGDAGTLLRSTDGGATWRGVATGTTYDLLDIDCKPGDLDTCLVVGEAGAAFRITHARDVTPPIMTAVTNITGTMGLPSDRALFTVGYVEDERVYIGSVNMVLASFLGSNFTTMPMNYLENDAYTVSTNGDGTGFIYGGGANPRIWFLHDYHTQSRAVTTSYASSLPADARISRVSLIDGNVTIAQQVIQVNVTRGGEWKTIGTLAEQEAEDDRRPFAAPGFVTFDGSTAGSDLRFNITMNTSGASTIMSPHLRWLTFGVDYYTGPVGSPTAGSTTIMVDFRSTAMRDATLTTADWNDSIDGLRQSLVREYWTRNVTGQVYDLRTGYNVVGDARDEIWVATGNILAENSPDHIIYAGTNLSRVVGNDDRVYMLDGRNGNPAAISPQLSGEVRHIRLVDADGNDWPELLFAVTWNATAENGKLHALNASTLDPLWTTDLQTETPVALGDGRFKGGHAAAFVGTAGTVGGNVAPSHLWGVNATTKAIEWRILPADMGKYLVVAPVPEGWLFGPYVVEVEVEWEETVTVEGGTAQNVLRSARFYDHFMATPPGALSPPTPVYTAKLLVWMRDWA